MAYISTKCVSGNHTECVTHSRMGYGGEACQCQCHELEGEAREVLTRMCSNETFRNKMLTLVHKYLKWKEGDPMDSFHNQGYAGI